MTTLTLSSRRPLGATLSGSRHATALTGFLLVVVAHWLEHVVQAIQVYGFGTVPPQARGVLGTAFPWLVSSEALHFGYALFMVAGLWLLLDGFTGRARQWWALALGIQCWHFVEHSLLIAQAHSGWHLNGEPVATSVLQLILPRLELHLFYNAVVFVPMVVAVLMHRNPGPEDRARMSCACAVSPGPGSAAR